VGHISRISPDACSAVCKGLFKKESDISFFEGAKVLTGRGEQGIIQVGGVSHTCIHFLLFVWPAVQDRGLCILVAR
jgi:hypothetical protein